MLAVVCIVTSAMIVMGVLHEAELRSWAMNPRTPGRVAHRITRGVAVTSGAIGSAVLIAGGATIMVVALLGSVDQAAGAL